MIPAPSRTSHGGSRRAWRRVPLCRSSSDRGRPGLVNGAVAQFRCDEKRQISGALAVMDGRHIQSQIALALKQAERGAVIDEVCFKMGFSDDVLRPAEEAWWTGGRPNCVI